MSKEDHPAVQRGTYRNHLDAELEVIAPINQLGPYRCLGRIWEARQHDPLFGVTPYLVTAKSLQEAGYSLVSNREADEGIS